MKSATLGCMGGSKKPSTESAQSLKPATALVRVHKDVAEMLGDLAQLTRTDIAEILSPIVRPILQKRLAEALDQRKRQLGN